MAELHDSDGEQVDESGASPRKRIKLTEFGNRHWDETSSPSRTQLFGNYVDLGIVVDRCKFTLEEALAMEKTGIFTFLSVLVSENTTDDAKRGSLLAIATAIGLDVPGALTAPGVIAPAQGTQLPGEGRKQEEEPKRNPLPTLDIDL